MPHVSAIKVDHFFVLSPMCGNDGVVFGSVTDKAAKKHACLIPYAQLSEADKQSDRDLVNGIPAILEKAGLGITDLAVQKSA